jgi:peptidoglycan/LPS O-acetylase OafA/YrhL
MNLAPYRKSITGFVVAGLTAVATAWADGEITGPEWIGVAVACMGTLGFVYAIPNRAPGEPRSSSPTSYPGA